MLVGDVHKATLLPKVALILKELYDCDIVEEEVLIEWGKKVGDMSLASHFGDIGKHCRPDQRMQRLIRVYTVCSQEFQTYDKNEKSSPDTP